MDCCPCRLCLLNTSANVYCQYCPRRQGLRRGAVLRSRCQASLKSPTSTLDRKRKTKRRRDVWSVEGLVILCFRSVHRWMGMDVWVNVFTMPFLCADSGPWRKMSRAWPAMSAIATSSGSTCPSHQESDRKRVLWRLLERVLLSGDVGVFVEHLC